jgi:hypothetical protein
MDMLGFQHTKNPLLTRTAFFGDLYSISPAWWEAHRDEEARMSQSSPAVSDAALVAVDDELAEQTVYVPIAKSPIWLFEHLPKNLADKHAGIRVFVEDPASKLMSELPPIVVEILQQFGPHVVIAGGAVLGAVSRFVYTHGSDVDLFVHGLSRTASDSLLHKIDAHVMSATGAYSKSASRVAVTYNRLKECEASENKLHDRPFQIVLGVHRARSHVIENFDLAPCKALAYIDESKRLRVEALPSFVLSMASMSFFVDIKYWSPASVARITKYIAKGFECAVPGVRREAFKKAITTKADHFKAETRSTWSYGTYVSEGYTKTRGPRQYSKWETDTEGIGILFVAESEVLRARSFTKKYEECEWTEAIHGRLQKVEAATIASKVKGKLGNGRRRLTFKELTDRQESQTSRYGFFAHYNMGPKVKSKSYGFIRCSFRRDVAVRLADDRRDIPLDTHFWEFSENGRFNPSTACWDDLYQPEVIERLATEEMAIRAIEVTERHKKNSKKGKKGKKRHARGN